MTVIYCLGCWTEYRVQRPAIVEIDDEPFCRDHMVREGYEEHEGKRVNVQPQQIQAEAAPVQAAPPAQTEEEEPPMLIKKALDERKCQNPECGKAFTPPHPLSNYCSVPCRGRANYLAKHSDAKAKAPANGKRIARPKPEETTTEPAQLEIRVSVKFLDGYLVGLAPERKAELVAAEMAQEG